MRDCSVRNNPAIWGKDVATLIRNNLNLCDNMRWWLGNSIP